MKKLLALVMSSLFVLTACTGEGNSKASETQATTVTTTVTTKAETTTTAAPEPPMTVLQVEDMTVNVCKKKQMTNTRASGSDDALRLIPPRRMSLEECIEGGIYECSWAADESIYKW